MANDDVFVMVTTIKSISDWEEVNLILRSHLVLVKEFLEDTENPSPAVVKRLKDLTQDIVSTYDKQPDNPNMDKITSMIGQMIEVIREAAQTVAEPTVTVTQIV